MRYDRPERRELLAADYVLGTLRGGARHRFERLMRRDPDVQEEVARWELRLGPLAAAVPPEKPPARVWRAVLREITPELAREARVRSSSRAVLAFWRGFGLAAAGLAVALALYIVITPVVPPGGAEAVALLSDDAGRASFLVEIESGRRVALRALAVEKAAAGRDYELWLLPKGGGAPHSLGVIPGAGRATLAVSSDNAALLPDAAALAVSLEPAGGSTTGAPTGPVLFKGAIHPTP